MIKSERRCKIRRKELYRAKRTKWVQMLTNDVVKEKGPKWPLRYIESTARKGQDQI